MPFVNCVVRTYSISPRLFRRPIAARSHESVPTWIRPAQRAGRGCYPFPVLLIRSFQTQYHPFQRNNQRKKQGFFICFSRVLYIVDQRFQRLLTGLIFITAIFPIKLPLSRLCPAHNPPVLRVLELSLPSRPGTNATTTYFLQSRGHSPKNETDDA